MNTIRHTIPGYVRDYIYKRGYTCPHTAMEPYIQEWDELFRAEGRFWDFEERASMGAIYKVHRRSIHPAKRVCDEWASLLMTDQTMVATDDETCTEWLDEALSRIDFLAHGEELVSRTFALGTGAWALMVDTETREIQVRRYDARQIIPLTWDDDGVSECAFVSTCVRAGHTFTQLQMHTQDSDGTYVLETHFFDASGHESAFEGIIPRFTTGSHIPWFAVFRPAGANIYIDGSPYGQSIYAGARDIMQSVDLCYDAIFNEVDLSKMRVFLSDMLLEQTTDDEGNWRLIPFGKSDCTLYRSVSSMDDTFIKEYAPQLRTSSQLEAYRLALKTMGDACGFGLTYFDVDNRTGGVKTATEVSAENSQLMRNIRKHEGPLGAAIKAICRALLECGREVFGEDLPDEGLIRVNFDDSIITDTAAEKAQDLAEVGTTMNAWEYRAKWYGEDEETARAMVPRTEVDLGLGELLNA